MTRRRADWLLAVGLGVAVALGHGWFFAEVIGLTYDEPVYAAVGERHWDWCARLLRLDSSAFGVAALDDGWGNSGPIPALADWHPPLGKLTLALGRRLPWPGGPFVRYRLGNVLLFAATGSLLFLWLGAVAGRTAGLAAALVWWTLPRAIGHGALAAIDLPVTFFGTLALALGWRLTQQPSASRGVGFGLGLAAACLAKFNGVMVTPAVLLVARGRGTWRALAVALLVAPAAGWLAWPWLWYDGFDHLRQVLAFHGRHGFIGVEYFGRIYADTAPPWHYPWVMLALTTPLLVLVAAGIGVRQSRARPLALLMVAGLICHLLPYSQPGAAKYNGVRLFLPALPLLAGLAGLGIGSVAAWLRRWLPRRGLAAALVALIVCLPSLLGVLRVHPYPLAYYNELTGGAAGADRRGFEAIYWGEPLRAACGWLSANAPPGAACRIHPPGFLSSLEMYRAVGILRADLRLVGDGPADFVVYQNRRSEWDEEGRRLAATKQPVHVILADKAPVAFIYAGD